MDRPFIKGLELCELFYREAVGPLLALRLPDLTYSAALIGPGSDVLGFDDAQSRDHDWGPRLMLFLTEADYCTQRDALDHLLRQELSAEIRGYPTRFGRHTDGTAAMMDDDGDMIPHGGALQHGVQLLTIQRFFKSALKFDPLGDIRAVDWLTTPENHLLMLTAGRVFHDGLGQGNVPGGLAAIRAKLRYYPHDVWLYRLAAQWRRIAQEEAFMGRCGQVGDDLGSRLVAARLVHDLMRLCFLMERRYAPYVKWLGTAFVQLECAARLAPVLTQVLAAQTWPEREEPLTAAYELAAELHNGLRITPPLPIRVSLYYARPFRVSHADRFVEAIRATITDQEVLELPEHLGSVDQFIDSTDALNHFEWFQAVFGVPQG